MLYRAKLKPREVDGHGWEKHPPVGNATELCKMAVPKTLESLVEVYGTDGDHGPIWFGALASFFFLWSLGCSVTGQSTEDETPVRHRPSQDS